MSLCAQSIKLQVSPFKTSLMACVSTHTISNGVCLCVTCRVFRARREEMKKKEREVANKLLQSHDPTASAATRHGWLMYTVPERPVAGVHPRAL